MNQHEQTIHRRGAMPKRKLDMAAKPDVFKNFPEAPFIPLPEGITCPVPFWETMLEYGRPSLTLSANLPLIATILRLGAGMSRTVSGLRTWPSAGALYPCEVYAQVHSVSDMADGIYHFSAQNGPDGPPVMHVLELEPEDETGSAENDVPSMRLIISGILERSAWKYQARGCRYVLLDAGHLAANLDLAMQAFNIDAKLILNFSEQAVAKTLGLDMEKEMPLAILEWGAPNSGWGEAEKGHDFISTRELAPKHEASLDAASILACYAPDKSVLSCYDPEKSLTLPEDFMTMRARVYSAGTDIMLDNVMHRRRSRRIFPEKGIAIERISLILKSVMPKPLPCYLTLILAPDSGAPKGSYLYAPFKPNHRLLLPGTMGEDLRPKIAKACLDQEVFASASFLAVFWADLAALEKDLGDTAYRHAMFAAGRAGERLYLAATALNMNCCGIAAFYDEELKEAAGLPANASPLYCIACG